MSVHITIGIPPRTPRLIVVAGLLFAYALVAYKLTSLPNNWLGVMVVLLVGVIAVLWVGQRHLLLLSALVVAIPLVGFDFSLYFNEKLGGDYRIAASLLDFSLIALWLEYWLTTPRAERRLLRPAALKWLMAGLYLLALLSLNFAKESSLTFFEIIRLTRMMALAWIVAKCVNSEAALKRVVVVLFAMTIMEGFLAYAQKLAGGQLGITLIGEPDKAMTQELNTGDTAIRASGTFGHTNQFARFLGLVLPIALAISIAAQNKRYRLFAGLTLLIGGGALIATLTRAAWIGVTIGGAIVFISMIMRPALREKAVRGLKLVLVMGAAFILINLGTFIARFTSEDEGSFATREPMARIAMKIIQDHPWGIGFGNYRLWLPSYGDPAVPFTFQAKVHNVYLLIAAELGIASLMVFLCILVVVFRHSLLLSKHAPTELAMVAVGIAGGLVAFAIHGLVDYEEIARIPILWFHAGLVGAITRLTQDSNNMIGGSLIKISPPEKNSLVR